MKPLRMHDENFVYFVTNRTHQERFFMVPTKQINSIIRFWLTKAKVLHGKNIEIYAFCFLSNHFHILLRDPQGELPRFMSYFQGNLARAVNRHIKRKGKFWNREYHDLIIDTVTSAEAFWNRYAYTVLNPVKSGLVATGRQWRGVCSLSHALDAAPIKGVGLNLSKYHDKTRHNQKVNKQDYEENFSFALTPPPFIADNSHDEQKKFIAELLKCSAAKYRKDLMYKAPLGMRKVLKQSFFDRPKSPKHSPRRRFMSFCEKAEKVFYETYKKFVADYKMAVHQLFIYYNNELENKWVSLYTSFPWPPGCYPPTKHKPAFM